MGFMGRKSTGAYTTTECKRIELSYLLKEGLFPKGGERTFLLHWNNTDRILVKAYNSVSEKYLELTYTITHWHNDSKTDYRYRIEIIPVPSNLGKGEVYYFLCPRTYQRCRVLYMAYGSGIWQCRQAYSQRIYYPLQQCSKLDKYNTIYWALEKRLFEGSRKRINATYRGQRSKTAIQQERRLNRYYHADAMRWSAAGIPQRLYSAIMAGR